MTHPIVPIIGGINRTGGIRGPEQLTTENDPKQHRLDVTAEDLHTTPKGDEVIVLHNNKRHAPPCDICLTTGVRLEYDVDRPREDLRSFPTYMYVCRYVR